VLSQGAYQWIYDPNDTPNNFPTTRLNGEAIKKGDWWTVANGGVVQGYNLYTNDVVSAIYDAPGQTASNWCVLPSYASFYDTLNNELATKLPSLPIYSGLPRGFLGVTATTTSNLLGKIWYVPYLVGEAHTVSSIQCAVTTGVAGGTVRMALYNDSNGQPSTLIEDVGTVAAVTSTDKVVAFAVNRSLTTSLVWMAIQVSSNTIALRFWSGGLHIIPRLTGAAPHMSFTQTIAYGAFPTSASGLASVGPNNQPVLELIPA
jgi:hypothetical protein